MQKLSLHVDSHVPGSTLQKLSYTLILKYKKCAARLFHVLLNENQHVAQLLLVCYQAVFNFFEHENQRVAQLLHLFWCAARLFQVVKSESTCS